MAPGACTDSLESLFFRYLNGIATAAKVQRKTTPRFIPRQPNPGMVIARDIATAFETPAKPLLEPIKRDSRIRVKIDIMQNMAHLPDRAKNK